MDCDEAKSSYFNESRNAKQFNTAENHMSSVISLESMIIIWDLKSSFFGFLYRNGFAK